jgi:ArsR family transcriptional regulator, arsenate/arsenite/antimonite-responsive transcriptional repressor
MKQTAAQLETLFAALADRTRLRLLNLISGGEVCVCFFVEVLGEPQPKISRHLGVLRAAGLVAARRDGKWMHYRLTLPEGAGEVVERAIAAMQSDPDLLRDRTALARACCSTRVPELLKRAPKPSFAG